MKLNDRLDKIAAWCWDHRRLNVLGGIGSAVAGTGIGNVLQGHSWGWWLIPAVLIPAFLSFFLFRQLGIRKRERIETLKIYAELLEFEAQRKRRVEAFRLNAEMMRRSSDSN